MAKSTNKQVELGEIVRRSAAARVAIGEAHESLMYKLNMPTRIKEFLSTTPVKWIGGSIVVGYLVSLFFKSRNKKKVRIWGKPVAKPKTKLLLLLGFVGTLSKAAVKMYATKRLKDYFGNQVAKGGGNSPNVLKRPPY